MLKVIGEPILSLTFHPCWLSELIAARALRGQISENSWRLLMSSLISNQENDRNSSCPRRTEEPLACAMIGVFLI
jgi:hypothetical protein